MSKTFDVDLRIRSQNLSKSSVKEIADDVERLAQAQVEQSRASALAARSMKDLAAESNYLAKAMRELQKRENATKAFIEQQEAIRRESEELRRLTAAFKELQATQNVSRDHVRELHAMEQQILNTKGRLDELVKTNEKARKSLGSLGVNADRAAEEFNEISAAARKTESAYEGSIKAVNGYSAAVKQSNDVQAEALRRNQEYTAQIERNRAALAQAAQQNQVRPDLQNLRADIEARSQQARAVEVQTEALRRLREEETRRSARVGGNAVAADQRARELAALKADIQERSALTARESEIQERSNQRRQRLIALIQSERGQRLLALEAQRREATETDRAAAAKGRYADSTQRAGSALKLFEDTGRKSLSTYQRLRGQILSITAAYVGFYQAVAQFQRAIEATNRNQALQIGLNRVNSGDIQAAASDYEFLRKEADRLGLVFDDLAPKFVGMAVSGKAVGLTGAQIREVFTDVATSVAASNLSLDDSEGVFRAIVQIMGKAKVQAEELRGQLGDRLPGAVAAFAKANNIALSELDDLLKKGKVGIPQLLKFLSQYADESATNIDQVTNRLQAYINRATNAYNDFLRSLLSGGNDQKLAQAFKRIEEFFKGRQGQEFAAGLAKVIGELIDLFIALADNLDKVVLVFKAFIALQAAKFFLDVYTQARALLGILSNLTTATVAYASASKAAALQTTAFGAASSRLAGFLGPIGALLATITGLLYSQSTALEHATDRLTDYTDTLYDAMQAKDLSQIEDAWKGVQDEIKKTDDDLAKLREAQKRMASLNPLDEFRQAGSAIAGDSNSVGIGVFSTSADVEEKINQALSRQANLRATLGDLMRKQIDERQRLLSQETKTPPADLGLGGDKDKTKKDKGRSPEDIARQQAAAQRQLAREALDLQDEIAQRLQQNGIKTEEQAEKNHQLQLRRNEIEFEDTIEKINGMRDAAAKANQEAQERGLPTIDISAQLTALDGLLQRRKAVSDQVAQENLELEKIAVREAEINRLIEERDAKLRLIQTMQENNQIGPVDAMRQANVVLEQYNQEIRTLTDELLRVLTAISADSDLAKRLGLDNLIAKYKIVNAEAAKLNNAQKFLRQWGEQLSGGVADSIVELGKGIAGVIQGTNSLGDAFKGAMDAFRNFAADFLQQIARMILQQIILNALQQAAQNAGGVLGQIAGIVVNAASGHTGGKVGSQRVGGNPTKSISPMAFLGAQKFHQGGVVPGMGPREVPIVAEMGEEILTRDDPRHMDNGGAVGKAQDITVIATLDPKNVVAQGFADARNAVLVDMQSNRTKYKRALGLTNF